MPPPIKIKKNYFKITKQNRTYKTSVQYNRSLKLPQMSNKHLVEKINTFMYTLESKPPDVSEIKVILAFQELFTYFKAQCYIRL